MILLHLFLNFNITLVQVCILSFGKNTGSNRNTCNKVMDLEICVATKRSYVFFCVASCYAFFYLKEIIIMALIKCPECGKENVSDTAEQCPECGYNVKKHIQNIKLQEYYKELELEKEQKQKQNMENNKALIERINKERQCKLKEIDNMPYPEKPNYFQLLIHNNDFGLVRYTLIALIISVFLIIVSFNSKSVFFTFIFLVAIIIEVGAFLLFSIWGYLEEKSFYEEQIKDFSGYKTNRKDRINKDYDDKIEHIKKNGREMPKTQSFNQTKSNVPKCPTCGSTNIKKISTTNRTISVATAGLASSKIGKQFECKNCGYKW